MITVKDIWGDIEKAGLAECVSKHEILKEIMFFSIYGEFQCAMQLFNPDEIAIAQTVVEVVKNVVDAVVNFIKGMMNGLFSGLKNSITKMESSLGNAYKGFILAVYNKNTQSELAEFGKIVAFMSAIAGVIFGVYWGLAIAINANPIVGAIITGIVSAAFMAVFYSLYPEEYRKAGEAIISVGDLLLKPPDELYNFDKQYAGSLGWFLTTITATMGAHWSGAVTNSAVSAFITWSLSIATLFAAIVIMDANYHDTTVKKIIAVGLLGIASYGLVSTVTAGLTGLGSVKTVGGILVHLILSTIFTIISAYSVLTTLGYFHKG